MAERLSERNLPGRVPPHNLRAEESVLGAMLLSREAIAEVVENLDPDHFYKPAHGHVYDAVMGLYGAGQPVDAVTVAEELQRAGLLDEIGGPALLLDLQANTPAISNAGHYAKIVEEHAMLRRLITVSNEIAETAYGVPDDVVKAIDDAEARMFEVAQRRVTNTTTEIKDLLSANLDRLEMLYERGESITGVSTGYVDLDELLSGLQPNSMYVIGARPAMGKALALDTPLATPDGWTTMGAVQVGEEVFDEDGQPTTVTYKSPVFHGHDCFEVEFDDGSVIVADADHQWFTWNHRAWTSRWERDARERRGPVEHPGAVLDQGDQHTWPTTRTTREIADTLRVGRDRRPNHRIPVAAPLECPEGEELPIDPYLLGCRLGDGHTGQPQITTMDREIVAVDPVPTHIPAAYLRSSSKQRLALLQGLMDTDGSVLDDEVVTGQRRCQLALSNEALLRQAWELALSLGYKTFPVVHGRSNVGVDMWRFSFSAPEPVFRLPRKAEAQHVVDRPDSLTRWRMITDVRPVPSVPTQCITVDSANHLYLAGREMIPTHNTAFSLGMAANAAMKDQKPVLIFNLEMSQLELSQRILCSEALVDSSRIRTGKIGEAEWTRISHAVGRLAEAPIYIDDNPHTSVMEIRAKARRLQSRVGDLGMVIVDYIQLMTGRSNAESRQVEVSEISRGLKILARELEAPVVALAQLNRQLEQRVDKRPMLSDLRESGCMPAGTRLQMADGSQRTLGDLLLTQDTPEVLAVDGRFRVVGRRLRTTFPSGRKMVYRLALASGRTVDATGCHRFMAVEGWRPLAELTAGEFVATPRLLPEPDQPAEWPEAEVILLAHLLGAGSVVNAVEYASVDEANLEAVYAAVRHFGCEADFEDAGDGGGESQRTGAVQVCVPTPHRSSDGRHHPIRDWLEPLGGWGTRSDEKAIPEEVHRLSTKQIALFLHHLWSTDGSITVAGNGRGRFVRCRYSTTSRDLALGVQRLLLRFEIRSAVAVARTAGFRNGYHVQVQGRPDLLRFMTEIGCHGQRGAVVPEAIEILRSLEPNPIVDPGDDEAIDFGPSDLHWDRIISIEPLGVQPVFDATIEEVHNFVANGVVAHNSLEQDADVVMFLYRDEVYDDQSPDKGIAEVIVAKHRNGPVGRVRMAFRGQYTRFDNMARSMPSGGPPSDAEPQADF